MNEDRYFIEEIKCGETEGGVACGPCPGATIISIRYRKGGESKWLHLTVFNGITTFMDTEKDLFDGLMDDEYVDKNIDMLNNITVKEINGINVSDDIHTMLESIKEQPDNPMVPLMNLFIVAYNSYDVEGFINSVKGKYVDQIKDLFQE